MPVLLWIVLWPLAEIVGFIVIGDQIGALNTVLLVIAAGLAGVAILRRQGLAALMAARADGPPAAGQVLDGLAVAVAGVLLMLPGFFSDAVGLALLIPGVRRGLGALVVRQVVGAGGEFRFRAGAARREPGGPAGRDGAGRGGGAAVIDVDFTEVAAEPVPPERRLEDGRPQGRQ